MNGSDHENNGMLFDGIVRFNIRILGLVLGLLIGTAIFLATNWLLIRGPHPDATGKLVVGPHLQLLSQFFIGYRVSFLGSVIGFFYGFALGTFCGGALGWIYDKIVDLRNPKTR